MKSVCRSNDVIKVGILIHLVRGAIKKKDSKVKTLAELA